MRNPIIGERIDIGDLHRQREIREIEYQDSVQQDSQILRVSGKPRPKGHAYTAITDRGPNK